MKKGIFIVILLFILTLSCSLGCASASSVFANSSNIDTINNASSLSKPYPKPSEKDSVIMLLLSPHIDKAINDYFGEPTQNELYFGVVDKISPIDDNFA